MSLKVSQIILHVAIPAPFRYTFDYLVPSDVTGKQLQPGMRVQVPFGRNRLIGVIDVVDNHSDFDINKLKPILSVVDEEPILDKSVLWLCRWASQYYHHAIGEVYSAALPASLRKGKVAIRIQQWQWRLTDSGRNAEVSARAHRQQQLLQRLSESVSGVAEADLREWQPDIMSILKKMQDKGWVERCSYEPDSHAAMACSEPDQMHVLNPAQQFAVESVQKKLSAYAAFLLYGVTGSGKTEVYLQIMKQVLASGRQVLILVPEIGLTPQLLQRFQRRFQCSIVTFHSGLGETERSQNWLQARSGEARIIIGTRSAVLTSMKTPGLIIVDEEHDVSFKQQDGFRYSARDVAIVRAHHENIPIILGSATPSLESMHNAQEGRYDLLELPERAGNAVHATMNLVDIRQQKLEEGLSETVLRHIRRHLDMGGQVLVFLNRRGYAPTLLCHDCGWVANCQRCDAHMTIHMASCQLRCHHCGTERRIESHCPDCGSADLHPIGQGTERTETVLKRHFSDVSIARIDRDTTRRKGEMARMLSEAENGQSRILLGTQLLAKGHHFPNVSLVVIVDSDQGLFSADFRGPERMAQLILQVSGRAGRAERPGEVIIQTHNPEHPLLHSIVQHDYRLISQQLLAERLDSGWPPASYMALLRAEATDQALPFHFLRDAIQQATLVENSPALLGPVAAPMEKRAGRYRAQLLIQSGNRAGLHEFLPVWLALIEKLKSSRKVRWSLDIDPQDMF